MNNPGTGTGGQRVATFASVIDGLSNTMLSLRSASSVRGKGEV